MISGFHNFRISALLSWLIWIFFESTGVFWMKNCGFCNARKRMVVILNFRKRLEVFVIFFDCFPNPVHLKICEIEFWDYTYKSETEIV